MGEADERQQGQPSGDGDAFGQRVRDVLFDQKGSRCDDEEQAASYVQHVGTFLLRGFECCSLDVPMLGKVPP